MKPSSILFRVDAGKVWGVSMGHLQRCLLIASKLKARHRIIFCMKGYSDGINFARRYGFEVEVIRDTDECSALKELCGKHRPRVVIFDLPKNHCADFLKYSKKSGIKTIVFDIAGRFRGKPDILINDSFEGSFRAYPDNMREVEKFLGPRYFVMKRTSGRAVFRDSVKRVLLTMGGSDPAGLTVKIIKVLRSMPGRTFLTTVVLGPLFSGEDSLEVSDQQNLRLIKDPPDFLSVLAQHDIVICAAGRTLLECAFFGRPVIIAPSIKHEEITAKIYSEKTHCFNLGRWNQARISKTLPSALDEYMSRLDLRREVSARSRRLVDGSGLYRVLKIINEQAK